jgi:hypothetical protein
MISLEISNASMPGKEINYQDSQEWLEINDQDTTYDLLSHQKLRNLAAKKRKSNLKQSSIHRFFSCS